jgi:transposase
MDIREIVRRLRAGESERAIQRDMGIHRKTVKRYREWAEAEGLLEGELPDLPTLQWKLEESMPEERPPQNTSTVEPYGELVKEMRSRNVEMAAIHQRLQDRGFEGGYMAVYRFVRKLEPGEPEATVRVETAPGEEAQVDFGYAGKMRDGEGELRKSWAFVMTLSYSRHQYVEFVFDQKVGTWLSCHQHAFEFFGGAPRRVVIDNLKAGIVKARVDDPLVQQSYRECAEHYGFLISPNRPGTPQHKGKVEKGGVHYLKRNFLGGREVTTISQANREVRTWCLETAGKRKHGTIQEQPLQRFEEVELAYLRPLPPAPYDMGIWKLLKLHRDGHVVFEGAYYSAPFEQIGRQVRVRGGHTQVRIYDTDYQLIATHERAAKPGERLTHPDHLPAYKWAGLQLSRESCLEEAATTGEHVFQVVQTLLDDPVVDRLRTAGRLLRLAERYGEARLEAACERAVAFDDPAYMTIKRILTQNLDQSALSPEPQPVPLARAFVRNVVELVGSLGGVSWN